MPVGRFVFVSKLKGGLCSELWQIHTVCSCCEAYACPKKDELRCCSADAGTHIIHAMAAQQHIVLHSLCACASFTLFSDHVHASGICLVRLYKLGLRLVSDRRCYYSCNSLIEVWRLLHQSEGHHWRCRLHPTWLHTVEVTAPSAMRHCKPTILP